MPKKAQIEAALASTRRPCVRLTLEPERTPGPLDSKFGGDFYLPAGQSAPDMEFLAQVNFSQAPRLEGFPENGLLQFFLRTGGEEFERFIEEESVFPQDCGFFQTVYYPEVPADGPACPDRVPAERWGMKKLLGGMGFEAGTEVASLCLGDDFILDLGCEAGAEAVRALFLEAGEGDEDYDLSDCGGVIDLTEDFGNWGCKLGGHPSLRYEDLRRENEAWTAYSILLFQLDLTLYEMRCDADTFCFFIKPEDLEARRFDRLLLTWHNCY